jgi:cellulose biosynthesis protein BcsQ
MSPPLIISIASGKGGVGKTMLTVATADELSRQSKTLVVDLDFFNRGLSGLFREWLPLERGGMKPLTIDRPDFLQPPTSDSTALEPKIEDQPWELWQVAENLFHIHFPDTSNREDDAVERGSEGGSRPERIALLTTELEKWLLGLASQFGFKAIVLDCHGGPDPLSFAAAIVADHTLLVSEPDRITLHGTLNFLRKLWRVCGEQSPDVRLVFNKVIPKFNVFFLKRFYNDNLRKEFYDDALLAVFPMEMYLTKEFEQTRLLTESYPHSALARKTRLMLRDLLLKEHAELLRPISIRQPAWLRKFRYYTMDRTLWVFDPSVVLNFFTGLALLWLICEAAIASITSPQPPDWLTKAMNSSWLKKDVDWVVGFAKTWFGWTMLGWVLSATLWRATVSLDRLGIRAARQHRKGLAVTLFLFLAILWVLGVVSTAETIHRLAHPYEHPFVEIFPFVWMALLCLWLVIKFLFRSYLQIRYAPAWLDISLQLGFVAYLIAGVVWAYIADVL